MKRQNLFIDNCLQLSYFLETVTLSERLLLVLIYPTWSVTLQSRPFSYNKRKQVICTLNVALISLVSVQAKSQITFCVGNVIIKY